MCFYDSDKNVIRSICEYDGSDKGYLERKVAIPVGAKFFRTTKWSSLDKGDFYASFFKKGNTLSLYESLNETPNISDDNYSDFSISDENGYDIFRIVGGHVQTKNFDSSKVAYKDEIPNPDDLQEIKEVADQILPILSLADAYATKDTTGCTSVTPITNEEWDGWNEQRYTFGFNSRQTPFYNRSFTVSDGTIVCAGDTSKLRWGYHVFEGYAKDQKSRITMLVNKHTEENKPLAELYYYLTAYNHYEGAYGFFKIGSDVRQHSFMYARDLAVSFGKHDFRNVIELASINLTTDIISTYDNIEDADVAYEPDSKYADNSKCVLYLALKNSRDGAIFYDNQRHKIVAKINGKWHDVLTQECPENTYNF